MWSRHVAVSFSRTYKGRHHAPHMFIIDRHFLYSFLPDPRISLVNILPMAQPLLPNTGYTRGTKTKDAFPSVTIQFRGLVSLTWMAQINTSSYTDGTGTTITLPFSLWLNIHSSGMWQKVAWQNCSWQEMSRRNSGRKGIQRYVAKSGMTKLFLARNVSTKFRPERKRNFMNIIPSTCFKYFFYCCFLLTVKPKQSQSQSIHFPGIASCLHLSSGGKQLCFETYLVQWNVGQSSCHDSCLGYR